ncbi:hypothetical protein FYJ36_14245 [[Clostridium] innocuum]|nr:hypothetical protein [[Clostridium] innocuum]
MSWKKIGNRCQHAYAEMIQDEYCDNRLKCRTQKIQRTCIFCGKTEREVTYMKDPPQRKLPYFCNHLK